MNDFVNYYDLLGIKKTATEEEIKKAYRQQAKKWHPDLNKEKDAPKISKQLNEAKEILLDSPKRQEYDKYLENLSNSKYENLKQQQKSPQPEEYYPNSSTKNYSRKEMYTKWQYFKMYLKYYQVSKKRKFVSIILVLTESLFCSILQLLNYLVALILNYTCTLITYLAQILLISYIFVIIFSIYNHTTLEPTNTSDYLDIALVVLLFITLIIFPFPLLKFLIYKMPIHLSNLNMYLFKKSIGYKN